MPDFVTEGAARKCPQCGTEIANSLLACPGCQRLVHSEQLKQLAVDAEAAMTAGELNKALGLWREAMDLLPQQSRQHEVILSRIQALSNQVDKKEKPHVASSTGGWKNATRGLGIGALLLSILSKGKLLILGLTKLGTLFSMLLSFGVYWTAWGWKFALGLVASIYVHEMGHIFMLQRYGIKATAPMFIPGFGAMVRLKQYPVTAREDARVGLAGPLWGLAASFSFYLLHLTTGIESFAGIARAGAWINLFNLIPIWQLDGYRGLRSLNRLQRWLLIVVTGCVLYGTGEKLLIVLLLFMLINAFAPAPEEHDTTGMAQFAFLIIALSALSAIPVAGLTLP